MIGVLTRIDNYFTEKTPDSLQKARELINFIRTGAPPINANGAAPLGLSYGDDDVCHL